MLDDEQVIERVLGGETGLFRLLVERYQRPVLRIAAGITGNHHLSEDVTQEVFLAAYRKLADFDSDRSRFSTWLITIARNRSINALNKKTPVCASSLPEVDSGRRPGDALDEQDLFAQLDRALATLPEEQKVAFVLAELEGVEYREIARIEGVKLGTIKSRISRAKAKLVQMLTNHWRKSDHDS